MSLVHDNGKLLPLVVVEFLVNERKPVQGRNDNPPLVVDCVFKDGGVVLVGNGRYLSLEVLEAKNGFLELPIQDTPVGNDEH